MKILSALIISLVWLVGCTDVRTYKYYDFSKELVKYDMGSISIFLIGKFKDTNSKKRITERGNPYKMVVRFTSPNKLEGKMIVENLQLSSKENEVIEFDFVYSSPEFKYDSNFEYSAGYTTSQFNLKYEPHRVSGKLILQDKVGNKILENDFEISFETNYREERQSDTISKILSG